MGDIKVVIADDHEPSRKILHRVLNSIKEVTIVAEAGNGEELIDTIRETIPDLVLLDINMPKINGINAIKESLIINPQLKVIFITGHSEHALEAFDISAVDYIVKPIDFDRLKKAVEKAKTDITMNQALTDAIHLNQYFEHHDDLSGLPNRKMFETKLNAEMDRAKYSNRMLAVMFLDLDRFKFINVSFGHTFGDQLLRKVAEKLKTCIHESDTISRQGGDEFIILLTNMTHKDDVLKVATNMLAEVQLPLIMNGYNLQPTISIGIAMFPNDGETAESLIRQAETAMYKAKESGRNNVKFFTSDMDKVSSKMIMEAALRKALDRQELQVYYQPIVNTVDKRIVGAEALLRWVHPELGMLSPLEFIPLAEETGLIIPIGEWVLKTACIQAKKWQLEGYSDLKISVNLSLLQFEQDNLVHSVTQILNDTGVHPSLLALEITESIALCNEIEVIHKLKALHDLGIRIAIDDFGTGYSSLSYLKKFPIHTLKIDKAFVRDITEGLDQTIISTIISMAKGLGFNVIAEGVESTSQYTVLNKLDCNEAQGFLFGKPMIASDFKEALGNNRSRIII